MKASKFARPGARKTRKFTKLPQFWSFSRWDDFHKCPFAYALKHIAKVKTGNVPSHVFERGNKVHALSEGFVKGEIKGVPPDLANFRQEYLAIRKLRAEAEVDYTITADWIPTRSDDFDNAWCRAKIDIVVERADPLTLIDVKTGRARPTHEAQGELYAMLGLDRFDPRDVEQCDVEFWYTDSGDTETLSFGRGKLDGLKKTWAKRIAPMLNGRLFQKTPSKNSCQYCAFRSDKTLADGSQGECDAWQKVASN